LSRREPEIKRSRGNSKNLKYESSRKSEEMKFVIRRLVRKAVNESLEVISMSEHPENKAGIQETRRPTTFLGQSRI
jgi:hypothetical protein